ncbi:hypothetical protein PILCRDRAFT_65478, partial [Piloderma croceum F 1598]
GVFEFKKNSSLTPENQVIIADPELTLHDITDEDEFPVLACDGIWECLESQQVVNFVRLKCNCDHCFERYTSLNATRLGCDNMTVIIVAILNGRTKEEWYNWVTGRVTLNRQ